MHLNDVVTRDANSMPTCLQTAAAPKETCKAVLVTFCIFFSVVDVSLLSDIMQRFEVHLDSLLGVVTFYG